MVRVKFSAGSLNAGGALAFRVGAEADEGGDGAVELGIGHGFDLFAAFRGEGLGGLFEEDGFIVLGGDGGVDMGGNANAVDDDTAGRVVFGGGELDGDGFGGVEIEGLDGLNGAFAEAGFANKDGPAKVFEGTGDDFRTAGTSSVDENGEGDIEVAFASPGLKRLPFVGARSAFSGDNFGTGREKASGDFDGGIEEAAVVVAEVEDEGAGTRGLELTKGCIKFLDGFFAEL